MTDVKRDTDSPVRQPADPSDSLGELPVVTPLRPTTRALPLRRLLNLASVIAAAILLVVVLTRLGPNVLPQGVSAQPTAHPTIMPYDTAPTAAPGSGWLLAGPDWAQDISFTADGAVAYTCGVVAGANLISTAMYDVSENRWSAAESVASGEGCHILVSPGNASDVALFVSSCIVCNQIVTTHLLRSHDGGKSWTRVWLPSSELPSTSAWLDDATFAVATVAIANNISPNTPPFHLYLSRVDGSLTAVNTGRLFGQRFAQLGPVDLYSNGATLYALLQPLTCAGDCQPNTQARTSDDGHTWTLSPMSYQGGLFLAGAQYNSDSLIGASYRSQDQTIGLVQSLDNGDHWQSLPALPRVEGLIIQALPDGSLFAWGYAAKDEPLGGVFMLPNGASTWLPIATLPVGQSLGIQCDAHGHAVALWGVAHQTSELGLTPGLAYHPITGNTP